MQIRLTENEYLKRINDNNLKQGECKDDHIIVDDLSDIVLEIGSKFIDNKDVEHAGTFILDRNLFLLTEFDNNPFDEATLGRNRVISVNPGACNIGREQRFIHYYIVLAEYKNMFIGIPITNMAYDNNTETYYLRNPFEVELINPSDSFKDKPFTEYWTTKPSVADIRNISGLDKRRILRNNLYTNRKYAPQAYMNAIKVKLITLFNLNL